MATPLLLVLILGVVLVAAAVWAAVAVVRMTCRLIGWVIGAPFRACRPRPRGDTILCGNLHCAAALPAVARYCSRCGAAVRAMQQVPARPRRAVRAVNVYARVA